MFFRSLIIMSAISFLTISCLSSNDEPQMQDESDVAIVGTSEYKAALINLHESSMSRSDDEPTEEEVAALIQLSKDFLKQNDIANEDLGLNNDDEIIPIVAMALLEYQNSIEASYESRTTVSGCIIEAFGIKEIIEQPAKYGAKQVAKIVAKAALKRVIPYVGWTIFAWDFISCVTE